MLKKAAFLALCPMFALGCAYQVGDEDALGDEPVAEVASAIDIENSLTENAISMNAISMNAISMNAMSAEAIPSSSMNVLQSTNGTLSRMLLKYLVSCSLASNQSFSFSWTDDVNVVHNETYWGALALAPGWATRGLTLTEQKWVSACIAARVNYYGVTVMISLRGQNPSLAADAYERANWDQPEGAFWGNIFAASPYMRSCYKPGSESHSRAKMRDCAAGHWDGVAALSCGSLLSQGSCDAICTPAPDATDGYTTCAGEGAVVSTYLQD